MSTRQIPITDIKVHDRHRRDLGDIAGLAQSIRALGLLHPIVVDPEHRLLAGQRRLEACRQLGWPDIEAKVLPAPKRGTECRLAPSYTIC